MAGDGITVASNLTFHAVDSSQPQAYPITYQSWVLVYETQPNANDAAMLKAYIGYLIGAGQQLLPSLGYAPLPTSIAAEGPSTAEHDRIVIVSNVTQAGQIGRSS